MRIECDKRREIGGQLQDEIVQGRRREAEKEGLHGGILEVMAKEDKRELRGRVKANEPTCEKELEDRKMGWINGAVGNNKFPDAAVNLETVLNSGREGKSFNKSGDDL
jgi:hypothetical protein